MWDTSPKKAHNVNTVNAYKYFTIMLNQSRRGSGLQYSRCVRFGSQCSAM